MRCLNVFPAALGLAVAVFGGHLFAANPPGAADRQAEEAKDLIVGEPLRYQNLTIFPVSSKVARDEDLYVTLDEGLRTKQVEVYEVGAGSRIGQSNRQAANRAQATESANPIREIDDGPNRSKNRTGRNSSRQIAQAQSSGEVGGDVNRVMVLNRSSKPLYLMPGEVIFGGKQDRCIGDELIIPPSEKPVPVQVFCIEHGRWSGRTETQGAAMLEILTDSGTDQKAIRQLSAEARKGKFVASGGNVNKSTRRSVQEGLGQSRVWDEVGQANARSGVQAQTGAFTENYVNRKVIGQLKGYLDKLEKPVLEHRQIVGVVVAINGKPDTMDVFHSTPLFLKLWPKLVKSYSLDALAASQEPDANKPCALADARSFFTEAVHGQEAGTTETRGKVAISRHQSERVVSFSARMAPTAMGGIGSANEKSTPAAKRNVHSSAYAK